MVTDLCDLTAKLNNKIQGVLKSSGELDDKSGQIKLEIERVERTLITRTLKILVYLVLLQGMTVFAKVFAHANPGYKHSVISLLFQSTHTFIKLLTREACAFHVCKAWA